MAREIVGHWVPVRAGTEEVADRVEGPPTGHHWPEAGLRIDAGPATSAPRMVASAKAPALSSGPVDPVPVSAASATIPATPPSMARGERTQELGVAPARGRAAALSGVTVVSPPDRITTGAPKGRPRATTSRADRGMDRPTSARLPSMRVGQGYRRTPAARAAFRRRLQRQARAEAITRTDVARENTGFIGMRCGDPHARSQSVHRSGGPGRNSGKATGLVQPRTGDGTVPPPRRPRPDHSPATSDTTRLRPGPDAPLPPSRPPLIRLTYFCGSRSSPRSARRRPEAGHQIACVVGQRPRAGRRRSRANPPPLYPRPQRPGHGAQPRDRVQQGRRRRRSPAAFGHGWAASTPGIVRVGPP